MHNLPRLHKIVWKYVQMILQVDLGVLTWRLNKSPWHKSDSRAFREVIAPLRKRACHENAFRLLPTPRCMPFCLMRVLHRTLFLNAQVRPLSTARQLEQALLCFTTRFPSSS